MQIVDDINIINKVIDSLKLKKRGLEVRIDAHYIVLDQSAAMKVIPKPHFSCGICRLKTHIKFGTKWGVVVVVVVVKCYLWGWQV